jgi:hypothetical protein
MASRKLLFPYNFTRADEKALRFVIDTFGSDPDLDITLFNAYTPVPDFDTSTGAALAGKMKRNLGYVSGQLREREAHLGRVKDALVDAGFSRDNVHLLFRPRKKDIASEIIGLADGGGFDLVVLSRKPGQVARFFRGNVYSKVVNALKDATICIVS